MNQMVSQQHKEHSLSRIHGNTTSELYAGYYVLIIIGIILLALGIFMTSSIHNWEIFRVWLPGCFVLLGLVLLGKEAYWTTIGVSLVLTGFAIWLHETSSRYFSNITQIIDWLFVIVGSIVISYALIQIWRKHRETLARHHTTT